MSALAKSLLAFQLDAPQIHTDSAGNFSNRYVSLPALMDAIRGSLAKQGLMLIQKPTVLENGAPGLITKLLHEDGEEEQAVMPLLLDKQNPQGLGSALTYARRQAALAFLGLAADTDDDGSAATNFSSAAVRPAVGEASSSDSSASNSSKDAHGLQSSRADAVLAGDALDDSGATLLSFGKHKNTAIKDIPRAYLEWWCGQETPKTDDLRRQRAAVEMFLGLAPVGASSDDDIPF